MTRDLMEQERGVNAYLTLLAQEPLLGGPQGNGSESMGILTRKREDYHKHKMNISPAQLKSQDFSSARR